MKGRDKNFVLRYTSRAMGVVDDMTDGSVSSLILNSVDSKENEDVLSLEDVAWADSCLIKDPETSESNWNSVKSALLDILSSQPERDGSSGGADIEILPSAEETETSQDLEITVPDIIPINEEAGKNRDDHLNNEKTDTLWLTNFGNVFLPTYEERTVDDIFPVNVEAQNNIDDSLIIEETDTWWSTSNLETVFLPTYREDLREIENLDAAVDLGFPAFVMEASTEDIFKVWDLEILGEEDELIKQLKKALSENSLLDDSVGWNGWKEGSLDDVISGIAGLSLNQNSG